MTEASTSRVAEFDASQRLALAIANALGLPGLGRLCSLSVQFTPDQPAVVRATFYADTDLLGAAVLPPLQAGVFRLVPAEKCAPEGLASGESGKG